MAFVVPSGKRLMVVALVYVHPEKPVDPKCHTMILLVRKRRPEWQRGKWNGPGGEVNADESIADAASRELAEETGLKIDAGKWDVVAIMGGKTFEVVFVKYHFPKGEFAPVLAPQLDEDIGRSGSEFFQWFPTDELPQPDRATGDGGIVYDLSWMVPYSLDGRFFPPTFHVRPDVEHDPKKPDTAPCIGGKETDAVTLPCDVKAGGKKIATGSVTGHRSDFIRPRLSTPTTVRDIRAGGEVAASFPQFVPTCPPVVPEPPFSYEEHPAATKGERERLYAADCEAEAARVQERAHVNDSGPPAVDVIPFDPPAAPEPQPDPPASDPSPDCGSCGGD